MENNNGFVKEGSERALKYRDMVLTGMGLEALSFTASGMPQADTPVIKRLAGKSPSQGKYGLAFDHFKKLGKEEEGIQVSLALENWINFKSIETLLNTYINPLQVSPDNTGRIHCSMNLNTETGRISCRKPNL